MDGWMECSFSVVPFIEFGQAASSGRTLPDPRAPDITIISSSFQTLSIPYPSTTSQLLPLILLDGRTQRPLLDHHRHDLEQDIGRRHRRVLGVGVVRRRHLDDVRGDEIDPVEAAQDGAELARGPSACFGGAGCGCDCVCRFISHIR